MKASFFIIQLRQGVEPREQASLRTATGASEVYRASEAADREEMAEGPLG